MASPPEDAFEAALAELAERFGWSPPALQAARRQRLALATHPTQAAAVLHERFRLPPPQIDALVALAPLAGASAATDAAPVPARTRWEPGVAATAPPPQAALSAPVARADTVGPMVRTPGEESAGAALHGATYAAWAAGRPPIDEARAVWLALVATVAVQHGAGAAWTGLDPDNLVVAPSAGVARIDASRPPRAGWTAPEVLRGAHPDARADVFALGALLFEALSGTPMFARVGETASTEAVLRDLRREAEPPLAPGDQALIDAATQADPTARPPDAAALLARATHTWRRPADASEDALADPAPAQARAAEQRVQADRHRADGEHAAALRCLEAAEAAEREADLASRAGIRALRDRLVRGDEGARERLLDALRAAHGYAAERGEDAPDLLDALVEVDVAGTHRTYAVGKGRFTLHTEPAGVEVDLYRYATREGRAWPEAVGNAGRTPVEDIALPIGSWVAVLRGSVDLRYPFVVRRRTRWHGVPPGSQAPLSLTLPDGLGADEVWVPAGWFRRGRRARWAWCDSFVLRRHPVRTREYLAFLTALRAAGDEDQLARCGFADGTLQVRWSGDRFELQRGSGARPWSAEWPAVGVPLEGARRFARWRSALDGHTWRLPTGPEWEKAARGVDGRCFPWGERVAPGYAALCADAPVGVDAMPADSSPYGVRGMGGNVADWVEQPGAPDGFGVARGGAWADPLDAARCAHVRHVPDHGGILVGFRLARGAT